MSHKLWTLTLRRLAEILLVAALYYLAAWCGSWVVQPHGDVVIVWPSAGLAVAALLTLGWHTSLGILVAALMFNGSRLSGAAALPLALVFAAAATLQAAVTAWALRRWTKVLPPATIHETLWAIAISALSTLIAPALGVTSACLAGIASWGDYLALAQAWWLADLIGVLIFTPSLLILFLRHVRQQKISEPFLWPIAAFTLGLALFTFCIVYYFGQDRLNLEFRHDGAEMSHILQDTIKQDVQSLIDLRSFYTSLGEITPDGFATFTAPLLASSPAISGLGWAPRVAQAERLAYEQAIRDQTFPGFLIYEEDGAGNLLPAAPRAEYFPVALVAPMSLNRNLLGFDLGSEAARLAAILQARDSGELAASAPIRLARKTGETGILLLLPVYRRAAPFNTLAERRANFVGLVNGVYRVDALLENAFSGLSRHDIEIYLYDLGEAGAAQFLTFYPSLSGPQTLSPGKVPDPAALQSGTTYTETIEVGNRNWLAIVRPGPAYSSVADVWLAWVSLLVGGLLTGGFLAYVATRQRTEAAIRRSEAEFRSLSDHALTGIIRFEFHGKIFYANEAAARMFGFASPKELLHLDPYSFLSDPGQAEALEQMLQTSSRALNQEIDILTAAGEKRHLLYSAALHEKIVSVTLADITDRMRASKELRLLSRIVSQMADTVVITDIHGMIEYVNPAFEQLTGYSRTEAIGQTPRLLKSGLHDGAFYRRLWSAILRGSVFQDDIVNRKKNGDLYYETKTITPIRGAGGEITHFVATGKDITERRRMELEIRERVKELTCLFAVSRLLQDSSVSVDWLCQQIVDSLAPAMQFPDLAAPLIEMEGKRYYTSLYDEVLSYCLSAPVVVNGTVCGRLAVYYTKDESFILPEEQTLLDNIARMLGLWFERRQSEMALRVSDERFRQLADNIQEVFWMDDRADNKIIYISPAYENVWGRSCQSLYENSLEYLTSILPEDQPIALEAMNQQTQGERTAVEYRILRPDGSVRWIWDRSFPIFDETSRLVRTAGVATDMTEIKTTQRQLEELNRELEKRVEERTAEVRQNEAIYRALFENSNDGIFLISPQKVDLQANPRGLEMLGYTHEEYLQLNAQRSNAVAAPEQQQDADERIEAVLRGESVPLYERTFIAKDGRSVDVEINLSAVRDANGKIILVQSVVRDITERKKASEALRESRDKLSAANAALEKASRLKDEFLASMSHELRTPLTGILGLSEVMQLQTLGPLNEKQLKAARNIEISGRHLLDLINDILDLSKIEAGKLDMQFETCSVADICQASLQLVKGMAGQKRQNISFSMDTTSIVVRADPRRLKQMLVNLLSNAVKFTPESGRLGLEVHGDADKKIVALGVWDKGIGIAPENLNKLFKPFVQLDSSLARQYSGTGLGLSLVQRMAEMHGGSVQVESTPGAGSRFTILLPWEGDGTPPPPAAPARRQTGSLKSTLLIEDSALDAEQAARYLKELGVASFIHPTLAGAFEKALALHPNAILLDLNLPDGSGLDLLARLKADARVRDIPVIITSVEERRAESMQLGAVGYLVKPFQRQDLQAELDKAAAFTRPNAPVMVVGPTTVAPLVMLADDNEMILEIVAGFLETQGYRVVATRSGIELLQRAAELRPDVMLVDIQMPGMDGLETIRRLRAHPDPRLASAAIIAVTALAMTGDREKCLQAGADEYISKPIVMAQLVERIKQFLKRKTNQV